MIRHWLLDPAGRLDAAVGPARVVLPPSVEKPGKDFAKACGR